MVDETKRKPALRHFPLKPHHLQDRRTPTDLVFYMAPLGMPTTETEGWQLTLDGLVDRPSTFTLDDILAMPARTFEAIHQCAGNPKTWDMPTRRITNVEWTGVPIFDLLVEAGMKPNASYLWSYGKDCGIYGTTIIDEYIKDIPLEVIKTSGALLAYQLNGEPLRPQHGHPLRVVVPGYYGTNSVKWLKRIRVEDRRSDGFFNTTLYNDPLPGDGTKPVWEIAPESVIVSPVPHAEIDLDIIDIRGWAWSRDEIASVDVSTDGGSSWTAASLERRREQTWQRFRYVWKPDRKSDGAVAVLMSRATDMRGETQPGTGARNAIYAVPTQLVASRL